MAPPKIGRRPPRAFLIEVTLVGLLVFAVAITIAIVTGATPGSTADWVAAISTFGALIAATFAAWYAAQAFAVERLREDRWEDSQRAAQAALVAAWTRPTLSTEVDERGRAESITGLTVWLRNASQVPVTKLEFELFVVRVESEGLSTTNIYRQSLHVLPPGDVPMELTIADPEAIEEASRSWVSRSEFEPELRVVLRFQDSAMVRWRRSSSGMLAVEDSDAKPHLLEHGPTGATGWTRQASL